MEPIRYDRRQVALMVKVAAFLNPDLVQRSSKAANRMAMVAVLGLHADGKGGFVWSPR